MSEGAKRGLKAIVSAAEAGYSRPIVRSSGRQRPGSVDSCIDRYVGEWENDEGNRLSIRKVDDETCFVSFYHAYDNQPIRRPWSAGKPSVEMIAKCKPADGPELVVQLGEEGTGFALHLLFEAAYFLDEAGRDAWSPD